MIEDALSKSVLDAFYEVYNESGDGFLEILYQRCLVIALRRRELRVETEVPVTIHYHGVAVGDYRLDLVVDRRIIVECKAGERLHLVHEYQLLNYLSATGLQVGFLFNFGPSPTFKRFVNERRTHASRKLTAVWK